MNLLIKDTTREEREQIIRQSLDCGGDVKTVRSIHILFTASHSKNRPAD